MKTIIIILSTFFLTIVTIACIVWGFYGKIIKVPPNIVRIEKPIRGDLVEFIKAPGIIEPETKVLIRSRISAKITDLPFKEGDYVTKGNPKANPPVAPSILLQLDDTSLKSDLRSSEAALSAQKAQVEVSRMQIEIQKSAVERVQISLDQAVKELDRYKELLKTNDVSQSEYDVKQSSVDELKVQLSSARKSLKNADLLLKISEHNLEAAGARVSLSKESLSYTTIFSPIDGVVTNLNSEVGEMATGSLYNPGNVILQVADLSKMIVKTQVDETDISNVKKGQAARIKIQAWPGMVFPGKVTSTALASSIDSRGSKYFKVEILIDKKGERILSGLTADVEIEIMKYKDIFKVPTQAVLFSPVDELPTEIRDKSPDVQKEKTLTTVVYRAINNEAVVTPVTIGKSDETHTIIKSGLSEADNVIVGPFKVLEKLKNKQKIKDEKELMAEKKSADKKASEKKAGDTKATEKNPGDKKSKTKI